MLFPIATGYHGQLRTLADNQAGCQWGNHFYFLNSDTALKLLNPFCFNAVVGNPWAEKEFVRHTHNSSKGTQNIHPYHFVLRGPVGPHKNCSRAACRLRVRRLPTSVPYALKCILLRPFSANQLIDSLAD